MSDSARILLVRCATLCHVIAILLLLGWILGSDVLFGHYRAPVGYLVLAAVAAALGSIFSVAWFVKAEGNWGIAGLFQPVFVIAALFIIWAGYVEYSRELAREARVPEAEKARKRVIQGKATQADLQVLRNALKTDGDGAWEAAVALKQMGSNAEPAIPDLVNAIRRGSTSLSPDHWKNALRVYSGDALAAIGPAAVPELIKLLADENPAVRLTAIESLGRINSQESHAAIKGMRKDPDENVRKATLRALERIYLEERREQASSPQPRPLHEELGIKLPIKNEDLPIVLKALNSEGDHSWQAARYLRTMKWGEAKSAVPALAEAVRRAVTPPPAQWKTLLLKECKATLERIGPFAVPALEELLSDKNPEVRATAREVLERMASYKYDKVREPAENALKAHAMREGRQR